MHSLAQVRSAVVSHQHLHRGQTEPLVLASVTSLPIEDSLRRLATLPANSTSPVSLDCVYGVTVSRCPSNEIYPPSTDEQLQAASKGLSGQAMPNFKSIGKDLAKEMNIEPPPETEEERASSTDLPAMMEAVQALTQRPLPFVQTAIGYCKMLFPRSVPYKRRQSAT